MHARRTVALVAGLIALSGVASSCSALKDPEPFIADITYSEGLGGAVTLQPAIVLGDTSFGEISVHNETSQKHGFAIRELAIFEEIPAGKSKLINIAEAKDDKEYTFECHIHDGEFSGKLQIDYVAENERR